MTEDRDSLAEEGEQGPDTAGLPFKIWVPGVIIVLLAMLLLTAR